MSKAGKFFGTLVVIIILVIGAGAVALSTVDINQYRDKIADALSKQTGRSVKFGGPIKLAISKHGIGVVVENASIGNPPWASRPDMASIGKLQLDVALMPLIDRKVVIAGLDIRNADIQLETNANNQHNWDMKPEGAAATPSETGGAPTVAPPSGGNTPVGVSIQELSIMNSQLAMRDKDGKVSVFKVDKLSLAPEDHGIGVSLSADYNGTPVKLALKTGASDLMADAKWPYDADLTYGVYHLNAQGSANLAAKTVELNPYVLAGGSSSLHGQIMANLGGAKSELRGTIMGDKFDPADFEPPSAGGDEKPATGAAPEASGGAKPLFSTAPLDLSALKSADATIDVALGEVTLGKASLKQVSGKLTLADGSLVLSPLKAMLGDSALQGDIKLTATSPAQYSLSFKAPGVDLASLLEMAGAAAFLSGKGDADIELSGSGNSLHEFASSTQGHIDITAAGGSISANAAGGMAAGLAQIFAPGGANPALNCLAARFVVTSGVGKDNGMLADSSASTVAGSGGFNLGNETVDLTLNAKPKLVNTQGLTPAVLISGPLASPKIGIDTAAAVQNVASTLLKNKLDGALGNAGGNNAESSVPALAEAPPGQNACLYTLDHKPAAAAAAPQNNAVKDVTGQAAGKVKNLGSQLKGLLGH